MPTRQKLTCMASKYSKTSALLLLILSADSFSNEQEIQGEEPVYDYITVTANRYSQNLQEVSSFVTVISDETLKHLKITDITGIEAISAGLRLGRSGDELRPAMRGARTNEVGVAGTGIAEQVVGIFIDEVYVPTTTAALGTFLDLERIEVLRGPQGTLYGRNTYAGSINVLSKQPEMEQFSAEADVTIGSYRYRKLEGIINQPWSKQLASRVVFASEKRDGVIENLVDPGKSDDLRQKDGWMFRAISLWQPNDSFEASLRMDYSQKDANSDAIWGYQQVAGYQLVPLDNHQGYQANALVTLGHIYQPADVKNDDLDPYHVYRNALSFSRNNHFTATLSASWLLDSMELGWISSFSRYSGQQFYDNDYSDGGLDVYGGFGRQDDQQTISSEIRLVSQQGSGANWITGIYFFDQEADWEWLWREDTDGDGSPNQITVPSWGNPRHEPHTVRSLAAYGQVTVDLTQASRLVLGGRYQKDDKTFTGSDIADWKDNAFLYKSAYEQDLTEQHFVYASIGTGYRTGGANDLRVVARGAPARYGNETVRSYEIGLNSLLASGSARLNLAIFANQYNDVKAQLFAVACNDPNDTSSTLECVESSTATTFEYYENGGNVAAIGLEVDAFWRLHNGWELDASIAFTDSEFEDGFELGSDTLKPYLGLGNIQGRQDINNAGSRFDYSGWTPAFSPKLDLSISLSKAIALSQLGTITPFLLVNYVSEHYAFDTNLPEVNVGSHLKVNASVTWDIDQHWQLSISAKNITQQQVMTRAVVHSQIVDGLPANSIQANWNDPRTFSISINYRF